MEKEIENRVKATTKRLAKILEENSGIEAPVENKDLEEYIRLVVKETQLIEKLYEELTLNDILPE